MAEQPRIVNIAEAISVHSGHGIAWLTLAMVWLTVLIVLLRYLFNINFIWLQEVVGYLHAFVFTVGAAYTLHADGHVRVDIFYARLGKRGQALINFLGALLMLLPFASFILYTSLDYVYLSWSLLESSREAGGLPFVYILKTAIPIMALLLILQALATVIRSGYELCGNPIDENRS